MTRRSTSLDYSSKISIRSSQGIPTGNLWPSGAENGHEHELPTTSIRASVPAPIGRARDLRRPCDGRLLIYARADETVGMGTTTATGSAPTPSALKPIDPAAFQAVVDAAAKKLMVPGAVVVLRTPQGTFDAMVGTTELGAQTQPDANTHFRIASNTKTMTAALIVLLAQDGKLQFSDPVSTYVPDVPNGKNITIAELLKMRSGLYNYTNAPELSATLDADPAKVWTPQEVLDIAFRHPPEFPPDTSYEYNNTNYALLGLIAEKAGGRPLAQQFQDRLFGPLGLTADLASRRRRQLHPGRPTRTATCTAEPPTQWSTSSTPPTCRPPHGPEHCNPSTTPTRTPPTPPPPGAPSPRRTTWPRGSEHWFRARSSTPTTSNNGCTACNPRTRTTPDGQKYGYGISLSAFRPERLDVLPRR